MSEGSPHPSPRPNRNRALIALGLTLLLAALVGLGVAFQRSRRSPVQRATPLGSVWASAVGSFAPPTPPPPAEPSDDELDFLPDTLAAQREALFKSLKDRLELSEEQVAEVRTIFEKSKVLSQGNPKKTRHPLKRSECRRLRKEAGLTDTNNPLCKAKYMVPLYDPGAGQTEVAARVCIDQYEFPDVPCEYPVVFARANEAVLLCRAVGKRLCDAHEWEGACAGALKPAEQEYVWGPERIETSYKHNQTREIRWAYGTKKDHSKCATGSFKHPKCNGSFTECGSNTYPAGAFPSCVSSLGVFDQHGNAAEHMNLPLKPEELARTGNYGSTEMKGSWFIFQSYEAHEDDCRWRALNWHGSLVMDPESHRNYHLGFRCCKDLSPEAGP